MTAGLIMTMASAMARVSAFSYQLPFADLRRDPVVVSTRALRGGALDLNGMLALRGGALDLKDMLAAAKDPQAMAELQAMMSDPQAMAEIRELMDDSAFRAEVEAALAMGGSDTMQELKSAVDSSSVNVATLGPPLGASLDTLKFQTSCDEFETAIGALRSVASRRAKDPKAIGAAGPRLRLDNVRLQEDLLRHEASRRCLRALGFTDDTSDEGFLLAGDTVWLDESQLKRAIAVLDEALADALRASELASAHSLPYKLALEMPNIRRACQREPGLGRSVTELLLSNAEFRTTVGTAETPMELALPSIAQLLRSKPGLQALLEFYTGVGPPNGTRVDRVHSVTEWKDALIAAGSKLVVVMFSTSTDVGCRILNPMFLRLPEANEGEFADGIAFVRVEVDGRQDDGLALQVFDEIGIAHQPVPTFAFLHECLELRKWRYQGADVGKIVSRIRKLKADPTDPLLRDGPDEDE